MRDILRKVITKILRIKKKYIIKTIDFSKSEYKEYIIDFVNKLRPLKTEFELIRVGGNNDGGYLLPDDLENIRGLVSPGVGSNSDFELHFANQMPCHLIDASIDKLPSHHNNFTFHKKYLSSTNSETTISIEKILRNMSLEPEDDLIMQMDIEGAEWEILEKVSLDLLTRFRIIVIEFHQFRRIFNDVKELKKVSKIFEKILSKFYVVHAHNNNCCPRIKIDDKYFSDLVELSFIRKDRVRQTQGYVQLPHELDQRNVTSNKDFHLHY